MPCAVNGGFFHKDKASYIATNKEQGNWTKQGLDDFFSDLQYKNCHPKHKSIFECNDPYSCCKYKGHCKLLHESSICDDKFVDEYFEFIYDILIAPIAEYLDKMNSTDKLIIFPSQVWHILCKVLWSKDSLFA